MSVHEKTEDNNRKSWFSRRKQHVVVDEEKDASGSEASVDVPAEQPPSRPEPVGFSELFRCVHLYDTCLFLVPTKIYPALQPRRSY